MKMTIDINLDNSAYYDDAIAELRENFEGIIKKLKCDDENGIIFDSNGNKTGQWRIGNE